MARGYGEELWHKDLTMIVAVDDKKNVLENFKSQLRHLFFLFFSFTVVLIILFISFLLIFVEFLSLFVLFSFDLNLNES